MTEHEMVPCPDCGRGHRYLRLNVAITCVCGRLIERHEQLALRQPESFTVTLTRAELALLHDLCDDHVGVARTAAFRAMRKGPGEWTRGADAWWAECELTGELRRRFERELDR
jgi:hypothetical protein